MDDKVMIKLLIVALTDAHNAIGEVTQDMGDEPLEYYGVKEDVDRSWRVLLRAVLGDEAAEDEDAGVVAMAKVREIRDSLEADAYEAMARAAERLLDGIRADVAPSETTKEASDE